jgi:TnpA family transposase
VPTRFLADAEIARLEGFPDTIERRDVARFFSLDGDDLRFVRQQYGAPGQLGIALQLCSPRWLGFVPDDLSSAPAEAIAELAGTLDVPARAIFEYAVRAETRREHRLAVRDHAGFVTAGEAELDQLRASLVESALEHERPSLLFSRACEESRRRRVERPAIDRLMRLVGWARERAHERTFERLSGQLTNDRRAALDALLTTEAGGRTRHAWLRARPTSVSGRAMRTELDKRAFLIEQLSADRFDLTALPPNRRAWLAQTGRRSTNQALARLDPERRYPVLMCFCAEALERVTDDCLEVFDRALGAADRAAQRKHEEIRRRHGRDTQTTVGRFVDLARMVLEAHDAQADALRLIDRRIGLERLRQDLNRAERINRPVEGHLDLLIEASGATGRKLLGALIEGIEFRPTGTDEDELLTGLRLIAQLAGTSRRWLPGFSPSAFVDQQWRAHVVDSARGRLDRRGYELCVAYELRSALRSGRVWVPGSRRHNDPASYLLPADRWRDLRERFAATVSRPLEVAGRLSELADEQAQLATRLSEVRDLESEARLVDGELITEDDTTGETGVLAQHIEQRLPEVDLPDLLIEVDGWTGFTGQLTPLSGNRSRSPDMPNAVFAAITAQATNLGLTGMARASEFSYDQLDCATEHYLREETLTDASACLVDYHHGLSLTSAWGAGRLSSSDGQRFASRTRGPATAALPRYFGHRRRGLQIYSWISDQYSQYASKVVAATVRDATHTLDGILDNQTVLPIEEHSTDTHGYTEMIFGAYDLLGLRFAPRIRDLERQRLYQHGPRAAVETAELIKHKLRPELITPYWDDLLRLAASLRHGWAPASLLLARLQAGSRRNPLARALQEYGRLIKTNFVLAWLVDEELRRRVGRQLNKGEQLHALRRFLFYANEGHVRQRTPEQQTEQALCLTIVCNAIIVLNTVYTQRVLDQLRAEGQLITTSETEQISPLPHQHINAYGHHAFDLASRPSAYRPLRSRRDVTPTTAKTPNRV